jgi:hypothetical protein
MDRSQTSPHPARRSPVTVDRARTRPPSECAGGPARTEAGTAGRRRIRRSVHRAAGHRPAGPDRARPACPPGGHRRSIERHPSRLALRRPGRGRCRRRPPVELDGGLPQQLGHRPWRRPVRPDDRDRGQQPGRSLDRPSGGSPGSGMPRAPRGIQPARSTNRGGIADVRVSGAGAIHARSRFRRGSLISRIVARVSVPVRSNRFATVVTLPDHHTRGAHQ